MDLKEKVSFVSQALEELYGAPKPDKGGNVLDCLMLTILSQNTTDINRDKGFSVLSARFATWQEVMRADVEAIGEAIRVAGLHAQKSRTMKDFLVWLKAEKGALDLQFLCDMGTDEALKFLCRHKGIGVKTASVTLSFACGHEVFPVDTHILRISKRLGFVPPNCSAEKAHDLMPEIVPDGKAYPLHMNLIAFGRQICNARKPKCDQCPLTMHCLYFREQL